MTIPIKVSKITKISSFAYVTIEINSINATTLLIKFTLFRSINSRALSKMIFTSIPDTVSENGLKFNEKFQVKAKFYNICR